MNRDVAASVRGRLMNQARETGRPFQELLQYFAMERFLFRLSKSEHADRFVLKGALMFAVWGTAQSRATRDIDLLARADNSVDAMTGMVKDICDQAVAPDGVNFVTDSNAFLARRETIVNVRWDPQLKTYEHWEFFYRASHVSGLKVAVETNCSVRHEHVDNSNYRSLRARSHFRAIGLRKHGFESMRYPGGGIVNA